jgi:hypothetical protein
LFRSPCFFVCAGAVFFPAVRMSACKDVYGVILPPPRACAGRFFLLACEPARLFSPAMRIRAAPVSLALGIFRVFCRPPQILRGAFFAAASSAATLPAWHHCPRFYRCQPHAPARFLRAALYSAKHARIFFAPPIAAYFRFFIPAQHRFMRRFLDPPDFFAPPQTAARVFTPPYGSCAAFFCFAAYTFFCRLPTALQVPAPCACTFFAVPQNAARTAAFCHTASGRWIFPCMRTICLS